MNPLKKLTELVTLKQLNLNLIADLLNTPTADLRELQNAKDTQNYLNYQISLIKTQIDGKLPIPVINSPIFQETDNSSFFASFQPTTLLSNSVSNLKEWEFNAMQLLPKDTHLNTYNPVLLERNKEEIIFRPSQEKLSGIIHLPEDNWVQNIPSTIQVQQIIEPIQEQLNIAPIKCEANESNVKSSNFIKIPETTTEIQQAVKRDLEYLQQNLEQQSIADTKEEDLYTDQYSEYYS